MKLKLANVFQATKGVLRKYQKIIVIVAMILVSLVILLVSVCNIWIQTYSSYVLSARSSQQASVGLVLGAGINKQGKPYKVLQARLDVAAQALQEHKVDKLILSGDNRFPNYNEPDAMIRYLVETKHIPAAQLQADYAGRDTYASCERAAKVFGLRETIIFSASSHLPRAIFLCRHFGIEAYGISSGVEANNSSRRELLASVKAVINVYVYSEKTVLGPPIKLGKTLNA